MITEHHAMDGERNTVVTSAPTHEDATITDLWHHSLMRFEDGGEHEEVVREETDDHYSHWVHFMD